MNLAQIAVLIAAAVSVGQLRRGRSLALLAVSTAAVFWLQPPETHPSLGFWLPYATLALTICGWLVSSHPDTREWKHTWPAAAVVTAVVLLIELGEFAGFPINVGIATPAPLRIALALAVTAGALAILGRWSSAQRWLLVLFSVSVLGIFVVLKSPGIAARVATALGEMLPLRDGSSIDTPLTWLGYSYVAFRLLHTVRDAQAGRLPALTLGEYVNYVIFFPSFTAGPIDRAERFVRELRSPPELHNDDWIDAGSRLVLGLFKKFVLADLLAVVSVSDLLVDYVTSPGWLWLLVYAYALRIYLDFSGYTDVAIGLGRLLGIRLPENFRAPYLKPNIALFWNSWHMSLTQWFRSYVFNPLTRQLRTARPAPPTWFAVLGAQLVTMVLIGLWHGITWNFALWGAWHAVGLFVHNRWAEFARTRWPEPVHPVLARAGSFLGTLITFNFVAVGWLFFALATPSTTYKALQMLVGAA